MAALSTAPLLARLLQGAMPSLAVLDGMLAEGGLYPWLPDALCGTAAPEALRAPDAALLRRFRQAGRPLFGFDPALDGALAAGAPAAWGDARERLVVLGAPTAREALGWLASGILVLARAAPPEPEGGRVMLLLGTPSPVERFDLLLPEGRLGATLPALAASARDLGGECGVREISPRLASLTLLATPPPCRVGLRGDRLIQDRVSEGRLRLLLGCLPPRPLRIRIAPGATAVPPMLFLDGSRVPPEGTGADGEAPALELVVTPGGCGPAVLGLAGRGAMPAPRHVEILA